MTTRRIIEFLLGRGYVRVLYNLEPSLVKLRRPVPPGPLYTALGMASVEPSGETEPTEVEKSISVCDLMDAVVMERWDTIALTLDLSIIEVIGLMEESLA